MASYFPVISAVLPKSAEFVESLSDRWLHLPPNEITRSLTLSQSSSVSFAALQNRGAKVNVFLSRYNCNQFSYQRSVVLHLQCLCETVNGASKGKGRRKSSIIAISPICFCEGRKANFEPTQLYSTIQNTSASVLKSINTI